MKEINGVKWERRVSFRRDGNRWRLNSCPLPGVLKLSPYYDPAFNEWNHQGARVCESEWPEGDRKIFAAVSSEDNKPDMHTRVRMSDDRESKNFWVFNPTHPLLVQLASGGRCVTMPRGRWLFENDEAWFLAQLRRINAMITRNTLTDDELLIRS